MNTRSLYAQYVGGVEFSKVSVVHYGSRWTVVGPGLRWLGEIFNTWQEAMNFADDWVRNNHTVRATCA